jgi:hypothetical protein
MSMADPMVVVKGVSGKIHPLSEKLKERNRAKRW